MSKLFGDIKFNGSWRPYQKKILDNLHSHTIDRKLHIVAAPGSGKTILGLEALIRMNSKALILVPTITIREQWIERFISYFVSDNRNVRDLITTDLKKPKFITVSTYQALHMAHNKFMNKEETDLDSDDFCEEIDEDYTSINLIEILKNNEIGTIVLDEAHHLRTEWWKSLTDVISSLGKIKIISLTATPPYDVPSSEWDKYNELCGSIDAEIYVPELVADNNLCPHQDYVYFNYPTEEEIKVIKEFKDNVKKAINDICKDQKFIDAIKNHIYIKDTFHNIEKILKEPDYYTSLLVFLKHVGANLPYKAVNILGHNSILPKLSLDRMETLLKGCLFTDVENYSNYEDTMKNTLKQLREIGCIEKRNICLKNNTSLNKLLVTSIGKLNSIKDIVKSELSNMKDDLKMIILTDFIRKDVLPKSYEAIIPINTIGVIPIFESLRRENIVNIKLAALSGSIIILPKTCLSKLYEILKVYNIINNNIKIKELNFDNNYFEFEITGESNKQKVSIISELFSRGEINVLIGTKSLLGEGWDEPTINSLIIASFVGSYMLSNQMRGRAIRVDKNNINKTSNIWHLVCVEKDELYQTNLVDMITIKINDSLYYGNNVLRSEDFETLKRRFKGFVGVSYSDDVIENGIDRLTIIKPPYTEGHLKEINEEMKKLSNKRDVLSQKWFRVINGNNSAGMVEEVKTNKEILPKKFLYLDTISILLLQSFSMTIYFILASLRVGNIVFGLIIINIIIVPSTLKAIILLLRFGTLKNSFKEVSKALLKTLIYLEIIKSDNPIVEVEKLNKYEISCYLLNATSYEKNIFNDCLEELLGVINNPRYLIERRGIIKIFKTKDYLVVPSIIGKNKEGAEFFSKQWCKFVGRNKIIYTRDMKGREILLHARTNSLSYQSLSKSERKLVFKNKWQ